MDVIHARDIDRKLREARTINCYSAIKIGRIIIKGSSISECRRSIWS